jgi:hypothetical protein
MVAKPITGKTDDVIVKTVAQLRFERDMTAARLSHILKERDEFFFIIASLLADLPERELRIPNATLERMQPFEMDYKLEIEQDVASKELVVRLTYAGADSSKGTQPG